MSTLKPMPCAHYIAPESVVRDGDVGLTPIEPGRTVVSIHQPDLLPYSGYFFKMATCDRFVIALHDQFQKHGYQRRVKMRDSWCSHQLDGKPSLVPIKTIRVLPGWQDRIVGVIRGRYQGARYYKTRGAELLDRIAQCEGETLDEVNLSMLEVCRDMLGITTPLVVTEEPVGAATERLIEETTMAGGDVYIAGAGGAAYMGDDAEERFADAGIELRWSQHQHLSGDSIVTVLMDFDDPMAAVLNRRGAEPAEEASHG